MPITLDPAGPDVLDVVDRVMAQYHPALIEHRVTVGLLMAWNSKKLLPAVKLHGVPCAAIIKNTPYLQRVHGIRDAVITFDGRLWKENSDAWRVALVDHELQHLSPLLDRKTDRLKEDALGRPKLRMRPHDWELSGFQIIAHRHGPQALEVQEFHRATKEFRQVLFTWGDDSAGSPGFTEEDVAKMDAHVKSALGPNVSVTLKGRSKGKAATAKGGVGGSTSDAAERS